jgi:hypothetical protein
MDVMITNNLNFKKQIVMYDLGYSDQLAQIVYIKVHKPAVGPTAIKKRQFTDNTIEEFMLLLQEESWDEDFFYQMMLIFPLRLS